MHIFQLEKKRKKVYPVSETRQEGRKNTELRYEKSNPARRNAELHSENVLIIYVDSTE